MVPKFPAVSLELVGPRDFPCASGSWVQGAHHVERRAAVSCDTSLHSGSLRVRSVTEVDGKQPPLPPPKQTITPPGLADLSVPQGAQGGMVGGLCVARTSVWAGGAKGGEPLS